MPYGTNLPPGMPASIRTTGDTCGKCGHEETVQFDGETGAWETLDRPVWELKNEEIDVVVFLCDDCLEEMRE